MLSSKRVSMPSTGTNSVDARWLFSIASNSTAANQLSPPASLATLPSWPNGESTKAVGRRRVLIRSLRQFGRRQTDRRSGGLGLAGVERGKPAGGLRADADLGAGGVEFQALLPPEDP